MRKQNKQVQILEPVPPLNFPDPDKMISDPDKMISARDKLTVAAVTTIAGISIAATLGIAGLVIGTALAVSSFSYGAYTLYQDQANQQQNRVTKVEFPGKAASVSPVQDYTRKRKPGGMDPSFRFINRPGLF